MSLSQRKEQHMTPVALALAGLMAVAGPGMIRAPRIRSTPDNFRYARCKCGSGEIYKRCCYLGKPSKATLDDLETDRQITEHIEHKHGIPTAEDARRAAKNSGMDPGYGR